MLGKIKFRLHAPEEMSLKHNISFHKHFKPIIYLQMTSEAKYFTDIINLQVRRQIRKKGFHNIIV